MMSDELPSNSPTGRQSDWLRLQSQALTPHATTPHLSASAPPLADLVPPVPPGYELLGPLGRGGMGVVWKARQTALGRIVALKVVAAGSAALPEERIRFRLEAEAAARLKHPGIVQVYEFGELPDGTAFLAMEYVEGGTLAERLGRPLDPRTAAELVAAVADAVHVAHVAGILHRDLKPANILLGLAEDGSANAETGQNALSLELRKPNAEFRHPKVADFGLAKRLDADSQLTADGLVIGTPAYMAPEQAAGQPGLTTHADIYALGAILYECLVGRPPYRGLSPLDTLRQAVQGPPPAPRELLPTLDGDLEAVCLRAMARTPDGRYPSAAALADDLRHWLAGEAVAAQPPTLGQFLRRWARQRLATAGKFAAMGLLGGGLASILLWALLLLPLLNLRAETYSRLPGTPGPWFATVVELPDAAAIVLVTATLLALGSLGWVAVCWVQPRDVGADLAAASAVSLTASLTLFLGGMG